MLIVQDLCKLKSEFLIFQSHFQSLILIQRKAFECSLNKMLATGRKYGCCPVSTNSTFDAPKDSIPLAVTLLWWHFYCPSFFSMFSKHLLVLVPDAVLAACYKCIIHIH
ncbi:hypothetical protein ILYODFUR_014465 [Ilyodon furcidens]|uniref:Uncharacterized protein n=1 Tax=Ilyodon furcidens TaxID=33524 RepID=A0ABV0TUL8_9TELE